MDDVVGQSGILSMFNCFKMGMEKRVSHKPCQSPWNSPRVCIGGKAGPKRQVPLNLASMGANQGLTSNVTDRCTDDPGVR